MPTNYLGTATGNTGIPSLLLSSLQKITDPDIQTALYQIQNWANSFRPLVSVSEVDGGQVGPQIDPSIQGVTVKTGVARGTTDAGGFLVVPFSPAYASSLVGAMATNVFTGGNHFWTELAVAALTGVTFQCLANNTTPVATTAVALFWIALGV